MHGAARMTVERIDTEKYAESVVNKSSNWKYMQKHWTEVLSEEYCFKYIETIISSPLKSFNLFLDSKMKYLIFVSIFCWKFYIRMIFIDKLRNVM